MNWKSRKLADIDQEIRGFARAAFGGEISYLTARHEIQALRDEREKIWARRYYG